MTREEAEKYAEKMTYREAIYNLKQAKSVPYRKATFIKVNELINELEQDKPLFAIDLYSVIKQSYIERGILDKIRAEIRKLDDINPDYPMDRTIHISRNEVLQIIDKYKAESEGK